MRIGIITIYLFLFSASYYAQTIPPIDKSEWKEVVSSEFEFKALFPTTPQTRIVDVLTNPIKRQNHWFEVSTPQMYFAVCFSDHPLLPNFDKAKLDENYDFLRDSVIKSVSAKLISEQSIDLDGKSGREIVMKIGSETGIDRFFLVDKRLYQIIVTFSSDDENKKEIKAQITTFLDSFKITRKSK